MNKTYHPQPYFKLPTLKPEGNVVETLYGREQNRVVTQALPAGISIPAATISTFSILSIPVGQLIKELQIFIPISYMLQLLNPTANDQSLTILSATVGLNLPAPIGAVYGTSFQLPFTGTPKIINFQFLEAYLPIWRWDDYSWILSGGNFTPLNFLNSLLLCNLTIQNTDGVAAHSFQPNVVLEYTTKNLEFS